MVDMKQKMDMSWQDAASFSARTSLDSLKDLLIAPTACHASTWVE